jgi:hypothetical protein
MNTFYNPDLDDVDPVMALWLLRAKGRRHRPLSGRARATLPCRS